VFKPNAKTISKTPAVNPVDVKVICKPFIEFSTIPNSMFATPVRNSPVSLIFVRYWISSSWKSSCKTCFLLVIYLLTPVKDFILIRGMPVVLSTLVFISFITESSCRSNSSVLAWSLLFCHGL